MATITLYGGPTALGQGNDHVGESRYDNPPWHLVDVWWDLGKDEPFESDSIDVTIADDLPPATNLYIAPIGLGGCASGFWRSVATEVKKGIRTALVWRHP